MVRKRQGIRNNVKHSMLSMCLDYLLHEKGKKGVNAGTGSHRVSPLAALSLPRMVNSVKNGTVTSGNLSKVIGAEGLSLIHI